MLSAEVKSLIKSEGFVLPQQLALKLFIGMLEITCFKI